MLGFDAVGRLALGQLPQATPPLFSWFAPLSEPVRVRPGLAPAQQQFSAFNPQPFVPFSWFEPLAEPVRKLPALNAAQVPFTTFNPQPFVPHDWYVPLSEPVRKRQGLDAARQQFLAAPSRLLPNPNVTGTLSAVESGDLFTGGGREWNRVVSGETGIIEQRFTGAETGVIQALPSVGASGVIEQIIPPVSGAAIPTITKANVSIIIL